MNELVKQLIAAGSGVKKYDYYIDSVSGNDSNSGTSKSTPKKTLMSLLVRYFSNKKIALKPSATYREVWAETMNLSDVTVSGAWTNNNDLTKVSGLSIISSWNKTAGYTNVYESLINCGFDINLTTGGAICLEIDPSTLELQPYSSSKMMNKATSLSNLDSSPGFLWWVRQSSTSYTIYIHTSASNNPTTNGKIYEVTSKKDVLLLTNYGADSVKGLRNKLSNLIIYNGWNKDGAKTGSATIIEKCVFAAGAIHAIVPDDGTIDQCVFFENQNTNDLVLVFSSYVTNNDCTVTNCIVFNDYQTYFMKSHNDDLGKHNQLTFRNVRLFGKCGLFSAIQEGYTNILVENCFVESTQMISGTTITGNSIMNNCVIKHTLEAAGNAVRDIKSMDNCLIYGNISAAFICSVVNMTHTIINAVDQVAANSNIYAQHYDHSIFIVNCYSSATKFINLMDDVVYTSDYNVFIYIGASNSRAFSYLNHYDGTSWPTIFAAHKTRSGQDLHSIIINIATVADLDTCFVDYTNGNYTVRTDTANGQAILAVGAGMRTPLLRYPTRPTKEQAVTSMLDGSLKTFNLFA